MFSFPHTPYLSKTFKNKDILGLHSAFNGCLPLIKTLDRCKKQRSSVLNTILAIYKGEPPTRVRPLPLLGKGIHPLLRFRKEKKSFALW